MLNTGNQQEYSRRQIFLSLLVILLCCIISYWPVSAGIFSLKNDATRYFLPVRFQISEMIRNGQFPFWTPYINLGHPLYTDMQSGVWNPFVWMISFSGSYTMRSLEAELMIYIYFSGVSMFFLLKHFKLTQLVSLTLAISYMLCGFISDSAQFPYWVCGLSFLPFVFLFFYKTIHELTFHSALFFSFSLYLLFVTGYPGEFIIIAWFLFAFFIIQIIQYKSQLLRLFTLLFFSTVVFTILSLPAIIAYLSGLSSLTRGTGISLDLAMTNSMAPLSLITYFFPLAGWKLPLSENDILGRNSFIGLIPLIFLFISIFTKTKTSLLKFLKWVYIISLLLSFGKYGGLRFISYYLLPGMNTFRHPSMFRFLSIFCGIILAAFAFQDIIQNKISSILKKYAFRTLLLLLTISCLIIIYYSTSIPAGILPASINSLSIKNWLEQSSLFNWLIPELIIQSVFILLIYQYLIKKLKIKIIAVAAILNSLIHTALIQPITVVKNQTVSSVQTVINSNRQDGFPLPFLNSTINSNSNTDEKLFAEIGPVNMYNKKHGYQFPFVTPGQLVLHEKFTAKEGLLNSIFNFPLLYKADTAFTYNDNPDLYNNKKIVLLEDTSLLSFINSGASDTICKTRMLNYSPNDWEFEIQSPTPGFYCLIQNYYPKWELFINGKKEPLYLCNISLIGIKLNSGKNTVKLQFRDNKVMTAFYLHLFVWTLFLIYFLVLFLKRIKVK